MQEYKKIGISGGTFDPVHHGHLIAAETVRDKFQLDRVIFIPSGMPPHKSSLNVTGAEHRYNMLCNAVQGNPYFEVSRMEIDRIGYTYTIDTLEQLKKGCQSDVKFFFITGADVVQELLLWKDCKRVFEMCEFVAAFRPGYEKTQFLKTIEFLRDKYNAKMHTIDIPLIEISSTAIRERAASKKSIKYLIPESVETYIMKNRLYGC